MIGLLLESGCH
uniref:Uncharacterized protein n=1 Tax=Rhizophora mucronata TaxID=61149 RepID=A0A2P2PHV4_RHIMU